jgi:mono/diheme cytochrome c family protein
MGNRTMIVNQTRFYTAVVSTLVSSVVTILFAQVPASAQRIDFGRIEYESKCASCHGVPGKGDGPVASLLNRKVPDLTTLAKNNNGVLPVAALYEVIYNEKEIPAHGSRDMPVWGREFRLEAGGYDEKAFPLYSERFNPEAYVHGRILSIIEYLNRLQEK